LLLSAGGAVLAFAASSVGFALAFATVLRWPAPVSAAARLSPERVLEAIVGGVRFARHEPKLGVALVRVLAFVLFSSSFWAVAPLGAG
jgi:hypothetical protein